MLLCFHQHSEEQTHTSIRMSSKWFEAAQSRGAVVRTDEQSNNTHARFMLSPYYEEGVAFDWSTLHARLAKDRSPPRPLDESLAAMEALSTEGKLVTTLKVQRLWEQTSLTPEASTMSVVQDLSTSEGGASWRFVKGCAGQESARDTAWRIIGNIVKQLRDGGVPCCAFLDTILVISDEFNLALTRTAAVYKALKGAGLSIDARRSNLEPRPAVALSRGRWTTLHTSSLKEDLLPAFLVDAFFQQLQDAYEWAAEKPLSVSPQELTALFVTFCEGVAKRRAAAGLSSELDSALITSVSKSVDNAAKNNSEKQLAEAVRETCASLLVSNSLAEHSGQPRWSAFELRMFLVLVA